MRISYLLCGLVFLWMTGVPAFAKSGAAKSDITEDKKEAEEDASVLAYIKGKEKILDGNYEEAVPLLEQALKSDPESATINHELSEAYLRISNFDRAEVLARKAVEKEPKNSEFIITLGGIYASEKKYPEAKEQYTKLMELEPTNQRVPLLLGILEAESGQMEKGIQILSKTIDANPDNYMAFFYRAKVYLEMEQVEKAKSDLDKCLTLRNNFVEAGTALGMLYERLGQVDDAIAAYIRIQGNGRYKKRLAQLYLAKNEFEKALDEFIEYEKLEPDDYTVKVKIGLIYFEIKKYDLAIQRFRAILKEQPEAGNVRFYLGVVLEEMKKTDDAVAAYKKVPADSSFYKEAMLHVGFIYKDEEKLKEGTDFSRRLLVNHSDIVEFYDMYASFYEAQKDFKKALGVIADGLKRYPKDEKLLYFQGALYDRLGDREHSVANMKKILEGDPNNAHALNFLGYTYAEAGENLEEAEGFIQKALILRPNDGYIEDSLGWVYFKRGKLDLAISQLEKASTTQADEPIIYEHLGDVYHQKKDLQKALEMYKKAEDLSSKKKDKDTVKKLEAKIASLEKEKRIPSSDK
jgi:tetratricopeptide (TPR) repeat protein